MFRLYCLLIGYALGCIQTAYIVGRIMGVDIRKHGSGNLGTTNSIRVLGKRAGGIVLFFDAIKAAAAFAIGMALFGESGVNWFMPGFTAPSAVLPGLYAGLGAVLGHNFPLYLRMKGGKGFAATLGLMLLMDWRPAIIVYAVGLITIILTKYISLAALIITLLFPIVLIAFGYGWEAIMIALVLGVMLWILHRGNIRRLLSGTERKLSLKKQGPGHAS